jgi:hypothetical protein
VDRCHHTRACGCERRSRFRAAFLDRCFITELAGIAASTQFGIYPIELAATNRCHCTKVLTDLVTMVFVVKGNFRVAAHSSNTIVQSTRLRISGLIVFRGFTVAHLVTVADIERSARFYETVFGGLVSPTAKWQQSVS